MALSGTIYGSTNNQYVAAKLVWSAAQNVTANTSSVTAKLYFWRTNSGYTTWGQCEGSITAGGASQSYSAQISMSGASESTASLAATKTFTVNHNADGTKSLTLSATGGISGTSFTSTSLSGTVTLDTIPRATTPVPSTTTPELGSTVTFTLKRASSAFTHDLYYKIGSDAWAWIGSGGTSVSWAIPLSLAENAPDSTKLTVTVFCQTLSGSTVIGTKSVTLTASVPASVKPVVSEGWYTCELTGDNATVNGWGVAVQGFSRAAVLFDTSKITLPYGASLASCKVTCGGTTVTSSPYTTPVFSAAGEIPVTCTATDSRGRSVSESFTVTVYPYAVPSLSAVSLYRCDSAGNAANDGTYVYAAATAQIAGCGGHNTGTMKAALLTAAGTAVSEESMESGVGAAHFQGAAAYTASYTARITLTDALGKTAVLSAVIPTANAAFHIREGGTAAAFGAYAEEDGVLYTPWHIRTDGQLTAGSAIIGGYAPRLIAEQGTSGIWTYIKYADGGAECWGTYSGTVSLRNSLDSAHYSDRIDVNYPFIFASAPVCTVSGGSNNKINWARRFAQALTDKATFLIVGLTAQTNVTVYVHIHAIGKWK